MPEFAEVAGKWLESIAEALALESIAEALALESIAGQRMATTAVPGMASTVGPVMPATVELAVASTGESTAQAPTEGLGASTAAAVPAVEATD